MAMMITPAIEEDNMSQIFIRPSRIGLIVRDPVSMTPLSNDGEWKPLDGKRGNYWRRRVLDGSVTQTKPQADQPKVEKPIVEKPKEETQQPVPELPKRQNKKDERRK